MEITDIRIFLRDTSGDSKLKAYVTLTFDRCFVVRNVKVIEGSKGLFVAMPSRKMKESCPKCGYENVVRSHFCNQCGTKLAERPRPSIGGAPGLSEEERQSEHKDIAHPITLEFREYIQKKVLEAYEVEKRKGPHTSPSTIEDPPE